MTFTFTTRRLIVSWTRAKEIAVAAGLTLIKTGDFNSGARVSGETAAVRTFLRDVVGIMDKAWTAHDAKK